MNTSAAGIRLICEFEGLRLKAYLCPAGVWTIGYGHTLTARKGKTITKEQALELLYSDLEVFEQIINYVVKVPLKQYQFDALVSFVFNIGIVNFKESTLLKRLNSGLFEDAAMEFMRWNKANGIVLSGLVKRREYERRLFLGYNGD